jgi:hypothetical protein
MPERPEGRNDRSASSFKNGASKEVAGEKLRE